MADAPTTPEVSARFADDTVQFMENMLRVARDLIDSQRELIEIVDAVQGELAAISAGERPSAARRAGPRSEAVAPARGTASIAVVSETLKDEARALRRSLDEAPAR